MVPATAIHFKLSGVTLSFQLHLEGHDPMDRDDLDRIMDFIIRQQERFAENLVRSDDRMTRLESGFVAAFKMISDTARAQDRLEKSQRKWQRETKKSQHELRESHHALQQELRESHQALQQELRESHQELQQELRRSHQALAASQKETDERLKLFISRVDHHLHPGNGSL